MIDLEDLKKAEKLRSQEEQNNELLITKNANIENELKDKDHQIEEEKLKQTRIDSRKLEVEI